MVTKHYINEIWITNFTIIWRLHDDVIKWKHFPRYWPFVRGIHRFPVNSPHKGQWRGALMFSLICVWINGWVNNHEAGGLRRYRAHYDVTVTIMVQCEKSRNGRWNSVTECMPNASQFACIDGQCLPDGLQCDGTKHCEDGSDETQLCSECPTHVHMLFCGLPETL